MRQEDKVPCPDSTVDCDLLVIGGGINGVGIARDAAGRGLSVVLCEKDDLASHTSSASTKLIHGGLRYLEHYEFGLVRKALREREILLRSAPHIMWPLRFVMPHHAGLRPKWMIRAGLFLYDRLAPRELLPASVAVDLRTHVAGQPLKGAFVSGFVYSDGWVDDARLVVLNAIDASAKGAQVLTRTRCVSAVRRNGFWLSQLMGVEGRLIEVKSRALVNAAGPWAATFLRTAMPTHQPRALRLIRGSHIVVKRLFDHPYAYIFQHIDNRIVFAIPYERDFTLIGTTDIDHEDAIHEVKIGPDEVNYLCELASSYFERRVTPVDVVWSYSGVRPLVEDEAANASAVTRDYRLELDVSDAPLLSVFGGKITTFRKLAEEAVNRLAPLLGNRHGPWSANACLPGGDVFGTRPCARGVTEFAQFVDALQQKYRWLDAMLVARYARAYGTRTNLMLRDCRCKADMGEEIATGLFAVEIDYLTEHEWARCAGDILWRRSKLGLHLPADTGMRLDTWLRSRRIAPNSFVPATP